MESQFEDSTILDTKDKLTVAVEGGLILAINVAALTGNLLMCLVMFKKPRFHTAANTFILSLAICHVFTACLVIPFTAGLVVAGKWPFGQVACEIQGFAFIVLTWVSLQLLTIVTVSRCFKVAHFAIHNKWFSLNRSIGMIMVIWVLDALVLICPITFGATTFKPTAERLLLCSIAPSYENRKVNITNTVITPILYMVLFITTIISRCAVKRQGEAMGSLLQAGRRISLLDMRTTAEERKTERVLLPLTTEVLVFWLPLIILNILEFPEQPIKTIPARVHLAFTILWFAVPVFHPVTYMAIYRPFSREVLRMLPSMSSRQNKVHAEEAMRG